MKINTASTLILAAAIVGGVSSRRVLQEVPRVGVDPTSPPAGNTSAPDPTTGTPAEEDLITALEFDAHITVVSPIEMGELMCSSLILAEDADALSFVITNDEVIVAEKSSYTVISGDTFTGNVGRKVWTGVVTDPEQAQDEAVPRTVSMTWGDVCSTETFLLQVTKVNVDGTTSIVKTVPCFGSSTHVCLLEALGASVQSTHTGMDTSKEATAAPPHSRPNESAASTQLVAATAAPRATIMSFFSGTSALTGTGTNVITSPTSAVSQAPTTGTGTGEAPAALAVTVNFDGPAAALVPPADLRVDSNSTSSQDDEANTGDDSDTADPGSRARRLQPGITVVDVMVLYSSESLLALGGITTVQMETNIIEATARTNEAFANSNVALSLNAVHIGPLPFAQTWTTTLDGVLDITDNVAIGMLRDEMGADLVQVVGDFDDGYCGRAWLFIGNSRYGFSVVGATCLADSTVANAYGHNLGCFPNREDTDFDTQYAHGLRYCSGVDPYRTIMSNTCGTPLVNHFSNPDVIVLDKPTGTATEDNARAIEDNMVTISKYRLSVSDAPPPSPAPSTAPPTTAPPSVPPPTSAPPTGYTLEGCYGDNTADRTLSGAYIKASQIMTTEVCAAHCQGSPYFGTEFGQECFCGVDSDDPDELGEAICNFECAGDPSQICGGRLAISVYTFGTDVPPAPAPPTPSPITPAPPTPSPITPTPTPEFLGCWMDLKSNRLMSLVESNSVMTIEVCAEICIEYPFFGTQWSKQCWCGDESTDFMKNGPSDACDRGCTGDNTQTCGGFDAMSVYQHETEDTNPEFLGCWTDTLDGRIMEWAASTQTMTNDCWCGDADTDHTVHGLSTSCNMPCIGDAGTICGGTFAMSVWQHQ